ncbi:MAG: bacillithiol biosynthesis deacetylase BshB1 [Saprospiraceae bacterium]|nr:bacillithiol biosynthesis deacetylase BshB1 [Saprospiraceae bacterium]
MANQKVDILAIGAHPDDVELSCSGTLLRHIDLGYKVGLVDLSQGELGTRGNATLRLEEAEASRKLMGAVVRENLGLPDGFFEQDKKSLIKLIYAIRKYRPDIVLANALEDRHPDHGRGADFISRACFLSGLIKIETTNDGVDQSHWRPRAIYHYIQDHHRTPDVVVDISDYLEKKMACIKCFSSQFYDPDSEEPESPISGKGFMDYIESKARIFGRYIDVDYAEGFEVSRPIGASDLIKLD